MPTEGIVDTHVHVWPAGTELDAGAAIDRAGILREFLRVAAGAGVDRAVLIQPSVLGHDHSYLASCVTEQTPVQLAGVAMVDPDVPGSGCSAISAVSTSSLVGLRIPLVRASDTWFRRIGRGYFAIADERGCLISLLVRPDQLDLVEAALIEFPSLAVVVEHLARIDLASDRRAATSRLCALAEYNNLYVKASALPFLSGDAWPYRSVRGELALVLDAFNGRVMWGSDYPFCLSSESYRRSADAARQAVASHDPGMVAQVMSGTAARLFFSHSEDTR